VRVLVEGKYRARMTDLDDGGKFLLAAVQPAPVRGPKEEDALQTDAMVRSLKSVFDDYLALNQRLAKDVVFASVSSAVPVFLSEYVPASLLCRDEDKQAVMDENTLTGRLEKLIELLRRECQVMEIERSEEHTSELQSRFDLVCRLLLEKKRANAEVKYGRT